MLPCGRVGAKLGFQIVHHLRRELRGKEKLAFELARVGIAKLGHHALAPRLIAHGQADVIVSAFEAFAFEHDAAHVFFVQALHDDDDGRPLGAVEPGRDSFGEPFERRGAHGV